MTTWALVTLLALVLLGLVGCTIGTVPIGTDAKGRVYHGLGFRWGVDLPWTTPEGGPRP